MGSFAKCCSDRSGRQGDRGSVSFYNGKSPWLARDDYRESGAHFAFKARDSVCRDNRYPGGMGGQFAICDVVG